MLVVIASPKPPACADTPKDKSETVGFTQDLLGQPARLFLDEPTNGLHPRGIRDFYRTLSELQALTVTVVLASHNCRM